MAGMAEWKAKISLDLDELRKQLQNAEDRLDKFGASDHKIKLNIDETVLDSAIKRLDKMLESLGKGTGDFKQFETLSKEISDMVSSVKDLSSAFGKLDGSGAQTLLSSIQNIDKSISSMNDNLIQMSKNFGDTVSSTKQQTNAIDNAYKTIINNAEQLEKVQDRITSKSNNSAVITGLQQESNKIQEVKDGYKDLLALQNSIKNVGKSNYSDKKNSDWVYSKYNSREEAVAGDLADKKNRLNSSINLILNEDRNAFAELEAEVNKYKTALSGVQQLVDRISSNSSISYLDKNNGSSEWYAGFANAYKEIDDRLGELNRSYQLTNQELEEYITLQIKAEKIIDRVGEASGGVKGSGAKNRTDLKIMTQRSFARDLGLNPDDIYNGLFSNITDALYGGNGISLFNEDGAKQSIRDIAAELLKYKSEFSGLTGALGAQEDANKLREINTVITYIKNNSKDIANTDFSAQIEQYSARVDELSKSLSDATDQKSIDLYTQLLNEDEEILNDLIAKQERLDSIRNSSAVSNNSDTLVQNQIQTELKETADQAEITGQALKELSQTTQRDNMDSVDSATTSATEAKNEFAKANENVQGSVDGSKSKLELEADLMDQIAKSARAAAEAKKEFVAANEKVANSIDKTEEKVKNPTTPVVKPSPTTTDSPKTKSDTNLQNYKNQLTVIQKLTDARTTLNNAERRNRNGSRDKEIADLKTQIAELEPKAKEAEQAIEKMYHPADGSKATITAEQYASALEKIKESATGSAKSVNDLAAAQKAALQSQISGYESDVSRWDKIVHDRETKPETGSQSSTYQNNLTAMKAAYKEMHDLQVKMSEAAKQGIGPSKEDVERFGELKTKLEGCEQSFKDLTAAQKGSTSLSRDKLFNKIGDYLHKNSGMAKEFKVQLEALQKELTLRGADANVSDLTDKFLKLQIAIREAGQEGRTFLDVVKDKAWYGLAGQIATYFSFQDIIRYIGQGIQVVRELDTARTEMMKVSDESEKSLRNYQKATFDVADAVGTTAKQIQNSTADYMRLGEALDDAAESARVANVLLNVSEFDNIEDATKSLVSMGQAYKDLDKMSIVDKLNEVGNNYSISTDELAGALQRSAATLSLMGNTIDEAAALVTTANSVIQDADSVSAGLRTISLRLVGTEEAEEELSAMNEEIDAFVAATNSKKQQIIKDYTAVASNNYKGFDILDDNGNYKNTYEILLGIAKVYKEIQEQDKKLGTNHAVALVEELAGKNRSNIASAILQDPKQLEAVRKSSEEAFGSAEEELGKYLDSIDGRLAKMTNRIQEFWSTTINDNAIKNIISFATTAIELFTKLSDTFGLVNVGALGLGAVLSTQNVGRGKMYPLMFEYADNNMCSLGY